MPGICFCLSLNLRSAIERDGLGVFNEFAGFNGIFALFYYRIFPIVVGLFIKLDRNFVLGNVT